MLYRVRQSLLAGMLISLDACSSQQVTVRPSPLWPFQQFEVAGGGTDVTSFYSSPAANPRQLVVVVQSPPCEELRSRPLFAQTISTSGVLWRQLQEDSAFLQFDRIGPSPAATSDSPAATHGCAATFSTDAWNRESAMTVAAVRRHEKLDRLATLYVGAGEGSHVAAQLAAADTNAAALVLINGSGMNRYFEGIIRSMRNRQSRDDDAMAAEEYETLRSVLVAETRLPIGLPILIVHGSADATAPVESAALLFSQLVQSGHNASMVVLDDYAHDLNLASDDQDCFEAAVQLIVSRARALIAAPGTGRGNLERVDCALATRQLSDATATANPR